LYEKWTLPSILPLMNPLPVGVLHQQGKVFVVGQEDQQPAGLYSQPTILGIVLMETVGTELAPGLKGTTTLRAETQC
jgi:hypothetical protein